MRTCAVCSAPSTHWGRCSEHYAELPSTSRGRRRVALDEGNNAAAILRKRIKGTMVECESCKRSLPASMVDIDHIIPLYQGGEDVPDNLQILCRSACHKTKTAMDAGRLPF